ncbi:hypothetical protein RD792_005915 [Penstemon davidsonii]|uniref:F-box/LRR-repeat protein 15-like leucin rich repeat domain-containing protein n=1 Tax=Penstemon davidsonii TaxID=160366 RepID=A0ABR0DER5_9LAMI|nr:hypothetical protein RD792_005915 [Penstemon davidsonii]
MVNLEQEGFQEGFPFPDDIVLTKILSKLELDSLCSLSCVCCSFPSRVDQVIPILPTLNLSAFSPNRELLDKIIPKLRGIKSITLDCLQLSARSIAQIFKPHIEELTLLKCGLPDDFVLSIGYRCPNLRILNLELVWENALFKEQLIKRLEQFLYLECLSIKLLGTENDPGIGFTLLILPKTIKTLKWQQVDNRYTNRPFSYPYLPDDDLTNDALKSLDLCPLLSSLSIVRSRARNPVACFFRVNDLGMSLLSSSCEALESVILGGFIKVTGVGFSSFLHSCPNLKKFEVRDAPLLTDLAFHNNNTGVVCHLVELKLVSCNHITSETLSKLASSTTL